MTLAPQGNSPRTRGWLTAALGVFGAALLLPLATFLVSVWLLGWQLQAVQTGSMAPTYPIGSLLVTGAVNPAEVEPGTALVFEDPATPGRLVTHRVVGYAAGDELGFITRGDANRTNDVAPVPARYVRGQVLWHVTHLGTVMDFLQWPRSFLLLVVAPAALLVLTDLRGRLTRRATQVHPGAPELGPAAQGAKE